MRDTSETRREPAGARDDAASSGVRAGYRVIDEQIRRGRRMAQALKDEPWSDGPRRPPRYRERRPWPGYQDEEPRSRYGEEPRYRGDAFELFGMPMRQLERLLREILRQIRSARPDPWRLAGLLFELQVEAVAELARFGFGTLGMAPPRWEDRFDEGVGQSHRDLDESFEEVDEEDLADERENEPADWLAPSTPTVIRSTVPIPIYVSSHERTEIDLDLPAGAQSLELEVEPLLVSGTEPAPPAFEADFIDIADGPAILRVEVPRDLPAGLYRRRILICATGEPVGDLRVQVGTIPVAPPPKASAKARKKR